MFWQIWDLYIVLLLLIFGGAYVFLLAIGVVKKKASKAQEKWEKRYKRISLIVGPLGNLGGILDYFLMPP